MFNLGYKEIVLNTLDGVSITPSGDVLRVQGYGTFKNTDAAFIANHSVVMAEAATAETKQFEVTIPNGVVAGDAIEVNFVIRSMRNSSDFARDFITDGKTFVWATRKLNAIDADSIAAAIVTGWDDMVGKHPEMEVYFKLKAIGSNVEVKAAIGYEFISLKSMSIKHVPVVKTVEAVFIPLAEDTTATVDGNPGLGLGKFLEESRRMATAQNVMPYAQQHGGNSQGIDVRGKYTAYQFEALEDSTAPGWESHDFVDHSYVQANMSSKARKYVMYVNENVDLSELDSFFGFTGRP